MLGVEVGNQTRKESSETVHRGLNERRSKDLCTGQTGHLLGRKFQK